LRQWIRWVAAGRTGEDEGMFPLDPFLLFFLKFFVVITCIVFWLRLAMEALMRNHRVHPPKSEED
jgi:hypothetical protein